MAQILIVDDEMITVEAIVSAVDWAKLGVAAVHKAYNIQQAKALFIQNNIELMLSDIEMPGGSGLELLSWVKEYSPDTESILLTCHADFGFARQAVKLGSFEYMLKPVVYPELEVIIEKAMDRIIRKRELAEHSRMAECWKRNRNRMVDRFWVDIAYRTIPSNPNAIREAAQDRQVDYSENQHYLPVMIAVKRFRKEISESETKLLEYALVNAAKEQFLSGGQAGEVVVYSDDYLLVLIKGNDKSQVSAESVVDASEAYVNFCHRYFYCDLRCYLGKLIKVHELADEMQTLLIRDRNNVAYDNRVFLYADSQLPLKMSDAPNHKIWETLLINGESERLLISANEYLSNLVRLGDIDADRLIQIKHDFLQMVYSVLKNKGIQASELFKDKRSIEVFAYATRSVTDLSDMFRYTVHIAVDSMVASKSLSVIDVVKNYIRANINQDLKRDEIAHQVYLHPDYLTRLFRKEEGMSIFDYILQERLKLAQSLLDGTEWKVRDVAGAVGYCNFSHFANIFKQHIGLSPLEYKNRLGQRIKDGI
ncbi:helix-turn-helix domain-containing protein [Paenibacillus sp. PL2-23]|uniref:response regulator transcription factor n=1 Tax=Paenibacillus sp. PL2-23 TaxID=2100729 RepID=UPI0030F6F24F